MTFFIPKGERNDSRNLATLILSDFFQMLLSFFGSVYGLFGVGVCPEQSRPEENRCGYIFPCDAALLASLLLEFLSFDIRSF